jgi:ketosteroid isomerase-like protein
MSQENVEAVNTLFAAFGRRDFEAAVGVLDPSVEVRPVIVGGPQGLVYRGLDGMRKFWADIDAAWAEFRITPEEFRELDGEILVFGRAFARGRESGIGIDAAAAWIVRLRQGEIVGFRSFSNPQNALEARRAAGVGRSLVGTIRTVCYRRDEVTR